MITFKPIIIQGGKRKDGTFPLYIRVYLNGTVKRVPTTLSCLPSQITRGGKIKSPDILNKADALIARMRAAVGDISPFDLEEWTAEKAVEYIRGKLTTSAFRLDFFDFAATYIQSKSVSTRGAYTQALNALERYLGERRLDVNDITRDLLLSFMENVDKESKMHYNRKLRAVVPIGAEKVPRAASSRHVAKLHNIFNAAKDKYNDEDTGRILIPRSPFDAVKLYRPASNGQKSLGVEGMQRIIDCQNAAPVLRTALDLFVLSFLLMGANMADLYDAGKINGREWRYNRTKTATRRADHAEMRVTIPPEALPYLERLKEGTGDSWLPGLHAFASNRNFATARVNRCLAKWCKDNGVEVFTFYAARHTWATLARAAGVDKSTIDDCLGHKGTYQIADIYAEKAWHLMTEANAKVIALFRWPEGQEGRKG